MADNPFDDIMLVSDSDESEGSDAPQPIPQDGPGDDNDDDEEEEYDEDDDEGEYDPQMKLDLQLWSACSSGDLSQVKELISTGASAMFRNFDCTPLTSSRDVRPEYSLFIAALNGHIDVVRYLIDCDGKDALIPANTLGGEQSSSALHFAAANDHVDIMQLLLDSPFPPLINLGTASGSALHYAALRGRINAVKFLIERDADVNLLCQKAPPIFWAAYQGKTEVCRYLWSKGADILLEDEDGENILFRPASSGGLETLKFLVEEAKCPVDARTKAGLSAFDRAHECHQSESALYLWRKGAPSVRSRSSKVQINHRRIYCINAPRYSEAATMGMIGSKIYLADTENHRMCTADVESITSVNLLSIYDISLPDPTVAAQRGFDPKRKGSLLELISPTEIRYAGSEADWSNSILADWAITPDDDFAYFEVTIKRKGSGLPEVAIGIGADDLDPSESLPGWQASSYGFHSDDGSFFCGDGWASMSLRIHQGETMGMGFIRKSSEIFITANGHFLGVGCVLPRLASLQELYAMVGIRTRGTSVSINFGQQPFKFDFMVDSISFSSRKIISRREPEICGHFSVQNSAFYWTEVDNVVSLKTDARKLQLHNIKYPPGAPDMFEHAYQTTIVDNTMWLLSIPDSTRTNIFPLFKIWSIDLTTFEAQHHTVDSSHLKKDLPDKLSDEFVLNEHNGKLYFINPPEQASFYFDTRDLSIHEINFNSAPTSYISTYLVDGHILAGSRPWELPYGAISLSIFEDGDWKSLRQTGPPVRSRYEDCAFTYKNNLIVFGGFRNEHIHPDFDIITLGKPSDAAKDAGNSALSFLLTSAGSALSDISLQFSDGKVLPLHKAVLWPRSEKLRALLEAADGSPTLQLDFPYDPYFRYIIEYIYQDSIDFISESVSAQQLAAMLDTWVPEHSLRACEYISLNRVMSPSILPNDLLRLFRYSHYTDITIKVGEYSLQAHKSILVARSEYFRAMLLGGLSEASQKEIVIPDVDGAVFEAVLRYIYTGELDATQFEELVIDVIVAASLFRVEGLIRLLESIIAHNLDQSNVESLLQLATTHNFERLKASCNQMIDAQVTTFE